VGTVAGFTALFSAAACCVLPLALAGLGIGAAGFAVFVPYHWPMTIIASVLIIAGWMLYLRKHRACSADADCAVPAPSRATLTMLVGATVIVGISALWGFIEQPLMRVLGGA
jgi:mercuric ion transport protein